MSKKTTAHDLPTRNPEDALMLLSIVDPERYRHTAAIVAYVLDRGWNDLSPADRKVAISAFDIRRAHAHALQCKGEA